MLFSELMSFFSERLKVYLRERGTRHDLIDAVFALPGQDDLLLFVSRVEALQRFLDTDDGKNLLVGYRRAANIVRAEEKNDGQGAFDGACDPTLLQDPAEKHLGSTFEISTAIPNGICSSPKPVPGGRNARDKRLLKMR